MINPFIDGKLGCLRRILIQKVLLQVSDKLIRRDALESEVIKVALQKLIETRAAESPFQMAQEERALLVRNLGRTVIRIAAFQIDVQNLIAIVERGNLFI